MDGASVCYAKRSKSIGERQVPYDFTRTRNLRNKTDEDMGAGAGREERETNHKRLLMTENKLRVDRGTWARGDGLDG